MSKVFMLLICLVCCIRLSAQKKTLKVKDPNLKKTYELFTVLQFNPDVKDGPYQHIIQGKLATEGSFHENRRGGLWTWYSVNGEPQCIVNYNTGIVHYSVKNGFVENWYDEKIVYDKDRSVINLLPGDVTYSIVAKNLRYPAYATERGIQGKVVIGITVNSEGKVNGYHVAESIDTSIDNAALNIVKLIPFDFLPAYKNGHPVMDDYFLPIRFMLQ